MKKVILLFGILTILSAPVANAFEIGVLGGVNYSNWSLDPAPEGTELNSKLGMDVGAIMSFGIVPMVFDLEVGALLDTRKVGTSFDITTPVAATGESETTFKYLQFPVILRFKLLPGLNFGAGAYYAMAMGDVTTKTTATIAGVSDTEEETNSWEAEGIKKSDYGAIAAIGYSIGLPVAKIFLDARYLMGLADINDNPDSDRSVKNTSIELLAGVTFGF